MILGQGNIDVADLPHWTNFVARPVRRQNNRNTEGNGLQPYNFGPARPRLHAYSPHIGPHTAVNLSFSIGQLHHST